MFAGQMFARRGRLCNREQQRGREESRHGASVPHGASCRDPARTLPGLSFAPPRRRRISLPVFLSSQLPCVCTLCCAELVWTL